MWYHNHIIQIIILINLKYSFMIITDNGLIYVVYSNNGMYDLHHILSSGFMKNCLIFNECSMNGIWDQLKPGIILHVSITICPEFTGWVGGMIL